MVDADCSFYSRGVFMADLFSEYVEMWVEGPNAFFSLTDVAISNFDTIEVDAWRGEDIEPPSKRATLPNRQVEIALDGGWNAILVSVSKRTAAHATWAAVFKIHRKSGAYSLERV
jgi:hypothetical protein